MPYRCFDEEEGSEGAVPEKGDERFELNSSRPNGEGLPSYPGPSSHAETESAAALLKEIRQEVHRALG